MEFRHLSIFIVLNFALVATRAALPPEMYWKSKLPSTQLPKTITDLLHLESTEEKITLVDVGKSGVHVDAGKTKPSGTSVNIEKDIKGQPGKGGFPMFYNYAASETQLHDKPNVALFFLEKDVHQGTKLNLQFTKTNSNDEAKFLPKEVANSIPFSSSKVQNILNMFSIKEGTEEFEIVKNTISECEENGIKGEEKLCVTSLESMVDFTISKLGNNVEAVSTEVDKNSNGLQQYVIAKGVKKLGDKNKTIVCHKENYPYALFYCHKIDATKVYSVPLEGVDGSGVKSIVVCHTDTSQWNPKHLAFHVLKVQPGTVPVCHILPQDHVVWVSK